MSDGIEIKITGLDGLIETLRELPIKLRRRALRNALAEGARIVRDAARANRRAASAASPNTGNAISQYRRHGVVAAAISVRTSKSARRAGDVGVFVNVRPLKENRSAHNPDDPFYWRFIEFGTQHSAARPFLRPAAAKLSEALTRFEAVIGPQIQRLDTSPKDPL